MFCKYSVSHRLSFEFISGTLNVKLFRQSDFWCDARLLEESRVVGDK